MDYKNKSNYVFTFGTERVILYKERNPVFHRKDRPMLTSNQIDLSNHRKLSTTISFFNLYKQVGKLTVSKDCNPSIIAYFHKSKITPHTLIAK